MWQIRLLYDLESKKKDYLQIGVLEQILALEMIFLRVPPVYTLNAPFLDLYVNLPHNYYRLWQEDHQLEIKDIVYPYSVFNLEVQVHHLCKQ